MKRIYRTVNVSLIILVLLTISTNLTAQNYWYSKERATTFSIRAGANLSEFSDMERAKNKAGFNIGVMADYAIRNTPISIQAGIEFANKGADNIDREGSTRLSYIQIPVHIAYKPYVSDKSKFVVYAGPYFAHGISSSSAWNGKDDVDLFDNGMLKKSDCGLSLGTGFEIDRIIMLVGMERGFTDISKIDGEKIKNASYRIILGYRF